MTHAYSSRIWKQPSPPPHTVYPPTVDATPPSPPLPGSKLTEQPPTAKKRVSFKSDDALVKVFEIPNSSSSSSSSSSAHHYHHHHQQHYHQHQHHATSACILKLPVRRMVSRQTMDARTLDLKAAMPGTSLQQRYRILQQASHVGRGFDEDWVLHTLSRSIGTIVRLLTN